MPEAPAAAGAGACLRLDHRGGQDVIAGMSELPILTGASLVLTGVGDGVGAAAVEEGDLLEELVDIHIAPALGRIRLKDLNPAHARFFYRERLDSGLAPATVHKIHAVLHKALKAAVSDGLIPRNTAAGLKLPRIAHEEIDPLGPEEARRLLDTGGRTSDRLEALYVLALKWDDVDLERGVVRVRRTLTREGGSYSLGEPKTKKSRRTIRLTAAAVEALRDHLSRQLEEMERMGSLYQPGGLVFATETGTISTPLTCATAPSSRC